MASGKITSIGLILTMLNFQTRSRDTYLRIKEDAELRPKSKMFGVRSLIFSLLLFLVVGGGIVGVLAIISGIGSNGLAVFGYILLLIALGALVLIFGIFLLTMSLTCWIYQIRLNKKFIGWFAMIINVISIIAIAVVVIAFLNASKN